MPNLAERFERQAAWQHARAKLSWTEKLRLAVELRRAALAMRPRSVRGSGSATKSESGEIPQLDQRQT